MKHASIDRTLSALADPHRRRVIDLLRERPWRAGELAEAAQISFPAMSRHLKTLRKSGVVAEYSLIDGGFALHEHNCPYSSAAKEHPEVCQVIHHVIDETLGGEHAQTESLAHGGKECRFELHPAET